MKISVRLLRPVLCGWMAAALWCLPAAGQNAVIDKELLAVERQSLQKILNNPGTDAETKALVREMLDWNAQGRTFADFQRLKGLKPAAPAQSSAANAAGNAIFGGGHKAGGSEPITGGHIPAPKHVQRITVAGEEGGMTAAPGLIRNKYTTDNLQTLAENKATGFREVLPAKSKVAVVGDPDTFESRLKPRAVKEITHINEGAGASADDMRAAAVKATVRRGDGAGAGAAAAQALPALRPADSAGGHIPPPVTPAVHLARVGAGTRLDDMAANAAREAKSVVKKDVAAWIEDAHFGPAKTMQARPAATLIGAGDVAAGRAVAAKPAVGVWAEANTARKQPLTAEKKVYTGPDKEIGGKGDAYTKKYETDGKGEFVRQQLQKEQDANRARMAQMTEAPSARGKVLDSADRAEINRSHGFAAERFNPMPDALAPTTPRVMLPGVSYHTPPPGYRGPDVLQRPPTPVASVHTPPPKPAATTVAIKPAPQIMMVDSFCPKHGKYGGQYKAGEKVECPQCKADKARPATTPRPQIMMVDSFCPKHGPYGGQYKAGEKVECPKCKSEKVQAATAVSRPAPVAAHTPPPKPAATTVAVKPAPMTMMIDAYCPKHGAYGGQYKPGEKVECLKCKAEKVQPGATRVAQPRPLYVDYEKPVTHVSPPARPGTQVVPTKDAAQVARPLVKPAVPQIAMVDAFCPKHKIKYGGQIRPGEKLECPRCKAEKLQAPPAEVNKPAPAVAHVPPPKPAVSTVMNIDAFCPLHKIKYGGQVRPGEKLECPKCKAEKNKPSTGYIR